jgi:hypothetical protein
MGLRLGDLLVEWGVITPAQRDGVLEYQHLSGRPFGEIAERLFGVSPSIIEKAWAEQYNTLAPRIDPRREIVDSEALALIDRRQAWQFRVLPIGYSGTELMVCTTKEHLVRAMKFISWKVPDACYFVLAEPLALGEALATHYPMAGMTPDSVNEPMRRVG